VLYFTEAGWHTDDGIGVRGVKFAAYFGQLTADTGALRLVPGSHHPEMHARLAAYQRRQPPVRNDAEAAAYRASIPGYVAATSPGDMIAFDLPGWSPTTPPGGRRTAITARRARRSGTPTLPGRCGTRSPRRSAGTITRCG
jgi:hypothetical protein